MSIASNCPKYANMLIDALKDLEDWSQHAHEIGIRMELGDFGFKEKVTFMAKDKGDNGKLAFLESLGLSLSSAMIIT